MKSFSKTILILGICLIALSGLEKIIIYASLNDRAGDYRTLKLITPDKIWNITQMTLYLGILMIVVGCITAMSRFINNSEFISTQREKLKEANRQFEIRNGMKNENKEE